MSEAIRTTEALVTQLFKQSFTIGNLAHLKQEMCINDLGYVFKWDKRSKKKLGSCNYTKKVITLSVKYVEQNFKDNFHLIEDTIRHEFAHAFSREYYGQKGSGHNKYWRAVCLQTGANPSRTKSGVNMDYKYSSYCSHCEEEKGGYHRKPTATRACYDCCIEHNNGKFDRRFILDVKQNY